jgi:hypothetical protein
MSSRRILQSFASSLASEVSLSAASKAVAFAPRWIRKKSIVDHGILSVEKKGTHRNPSYTQSGYLLAPLATFGASSEKLFGGPLPSSQVGQLLLGPCSQQQQQQRRGASTSSGVEQDNKGQAPPNKEIKRIVWKTEENSLGKRFSWLLRIVGFYSSDAKMLRCSAKLYLNARKQASRKEVRHVSVHLCETCDYLDQVPPPWTHRRALTCWLKKQFATFCGVGEDFTARFYLECLHVWMVLVRLRKEGKASATLKQDFFDRFWEDMTSQVCMKPLQLVQHC